MTDDFWLAVFIVCQVSAIGLMFKYAMRDVDDISNNTVEIHNKTDESA